MIKEARIYNGDFPISGAVGWENWTATSKE